jgi:hypothetical protein
MLRGVLQERAAGAVDGLGDQFVGRAGPGEQGVGLIEFL